MWWDDGRERNAYVMGLGTNYSDNVEFVGSAQIVPGWSAGYVLYLEARANNIYSLDQQHPDSLDANSVSAEQSYWYIKSDHWGMARVGKSNPVGDNAGFDADLSGTQPAAYSVVYDAWSFALRAKHGGATIVDPDGSSINHSVEDVFGEGFTWGGGKGASGGVCHGWGGGFADCIGSPRNEVRYDSPVIAGFQVATSWGEDDEWGVRGTYTGTWGDFSVKIIDAYSQTNDPHLHVPNPDVVAGAFPESHYNELAGYIEHVPTGLWWKGEWDRMTADDYRANDVWYTKGGIKLKCFPWSFLGQTLPYVEYARVNDGIYDNGGHFVPGHQTYWGGGVVQNIDAAAMQVWLRGRVMSQEISSGFLAEGSSQAHDFTEIVGGALIAF
jgi:hypothetical protein